MGLAFIPLAVITLKPVPEPYYEAIHDEVNGTCYVNKTSVNNAGAKEQGLQYVLINTLAFLMLSFADVAADGLKVSVLFSSHVSCLKRKSIIQHSGFFYIMSAN